MTLVAIRETDEIEGSIETFIPALRQAIEPRIDRSTIDRSWGPQAPVTYDNHNLRAPSRKLAEILKPAYELDVPFQAVQAWEGVVEEAGADLVYVRLFDKTDFRRPETLASIRREEIDPEDQDLVREGATFYWTIGYEMPPSGRRRASYIRFRRMPVWTTRDIEEASRRVDDMLRN